MSALSSWSQIPALTALTVEFEASVKLTLPPSSLSLSRKSLTAASNPASLLPLTATLLPSAWEDAMEPPGGVSPQSLHSRH